MAVIAVTVRAVLPQKISKFQFLLGGRDVVVLRGGRSVEIGVRGERPCRTNGGVLAGREQEPLCREWGVNAGTGRGRWQRTCGVGMRMICDEVLWFCRASEQMIILPNTLYENGELSDFCRQKVR